ncbi:MAG: ABC transporter substrate-binding protein [Myxococcota bacterium]
MKPFMQTGFSVFALALLLCLTVFNTCQINNLERRLRDGEIVARSPDPELSPPPQNSAAELGGDPGNLLNSRTRPLNDDATIKRGGHLRMQAGQDPAGFNPYIANGADAAEFARYINNMLCQRDVDEPGRLTPDLATSIRTPDGGYTYEVEIRRGVYWHSPAVELRDPKFAWLRGEHELTSDDFLFVFDMMANPQVTGRISHQRNYFSGATAEANGRYGFTVRFEKRAYTNLSNLCSMHPSPRWLMMFDESGKKFSDSEWGVKVSEHWYNNRGIGTGPYRFVEWVPGSHIRFEKNERYFGEPPAFDGVTVRIIKDQNAWTRLLKTGELDVTRIQPEQYRTEVLERDGPPLGNPQIRQTRREELGYFYVGWNMDTPYFNTKEARQAMTLALDREGIVKNVFHGLGDVLHGPFPLKNPCYDHSVEGWPYDLDRARAKLDEAGWVDTDGDGIRDRLVDGKRIPFEFDLMIYGSSTEFATVANIYREALLRIGVRLNPKPLEWSTLLKRIEERSFESYTAAWVMDWEIDLYQLWHSSEADQPKSSNRIGFRSAKADRIIEALRESFDQEERVKLCHEFHALVHELQPYTFIYQRWRPVLYWDHMNEPEFHKVYPFRDPRLMSFNHLPVH